MVRRISMEEIDKDDPDFNCSSDTTVEEINESSVRDVTIEENNEYTYMTYENFNIPDQLLPVSGNDSDNVSQEIYSEISGFGFEAMKLTCDFLNYLIDRSNNMITTDQQFVTPHVDMNMKRNIMYPYAFYNKSKRRRPPKTKISIELQGSLGQANILAAQGNHKGAVDLCLKLIESTPNAWEPLHTLAFVYKEAFDHTKYLEYLLVCAQIKKNDCQLWGQIGNEFLDSNRSEWAQSCYERALRCNILYIPTIWEWACINFKSGYIFSTSNILFKFLRFVDVEHFETIFSITKVLIKVYLKLRQESKLLLHLQSLLPHLYPHIDSNIIEIYLKLIMDNKNYTMVYNEIVYYFNMTSLITNYNPNKTDINFSEYLHENATQEITNLMKMLPPNILLFFATSTINIYPMKHVVDFFMDILMKSQITDHTCKLINVLYRNGYYTSCVMYFDTLSISIYDTPIDFENDHFYCWINMAECYWKLGHIIHDGISKSLSIYDTIINHSNIINHPKYSKYNHINMLAAIANIKNTNFDQAFQYIQNYLKHAITSIYNVYIMEFLAQQMDLLIHQHLNNNIVEGEFYAVDQFLTNSLMLIWAGRYQENVTNDSSYLKNMLQKMFWCIDNIKLFTVEQLKYYMKLFLSYMNNTFDQHKLPSSDSFREELHWRFVSLCIQNGWFHIALNTILKYTTNLSEPMKLLENNFFWNIFSLLLHRIKFNLHTKRLLNIAINNMLHMEQQNSEKALLAIGHYKLMSYENYRALEKYYSLCSPPNNEEPNRFLFMSVAMANIAYRKHLDNYCSIALQSACVMQHYFKLKGKYCSQEACYNMGRCYHQMKLYHLAISFYEKGLQLNDSDDNLYSIIAYNLAHIYAKSGNNLLAKQLLHNYCTI